jgi:hypothetical protein
MNQRIGSIKELDDLADTLRESWVLAQAFLLSDVRRDVGGEGCDEEMLQLNDPLQAMLWAGCYAVGRRLLRLPNCSAIKLQAALELLHICPLLRSMSQRLVELGKLEVQAKSGHVEVMEFKRDLMEILLRIRIALQMAGKRVRLKDLTLD